MNGSFAIDAKNQLAFGDLRATLMACEPALMQADQTIRALLSKPQQPHVEQSESPRLQLISTTGETSNWIGQPTAETRYGSTGETMFLEVAPKRVACSHPMMPNYQCLQVREIHYDEKGIKQSPPGQWQSLYQEIEDFDFHEGERKVLRLKKLKRNPAPADASSIVYVLDMTVETEVVPASKK
jgi:hypothetical protein